jgi:hypothetical protein
MTYGNIDGDSIYNNTVYMSSASSGTPFPLEVYALGSSGQTTIRNNIFEIGSGLTYDVYVSYAPATTSLEMQGNDYYPFSIYYGSSSYTSLSSFESGSGQEELNGTAVGFSTAPGLTDAGSGTAITDSTQLDTLTAYKLASTSAMKNAGINLTTQFGTSIGNTDFFGTSVPSSSGVSVGAAQ